MKLNPRIIVFAFFYLSQAVFAQGHSTVIPEVRQSNQPVVNRRYAQVQTTHIKREEIKTSPATNLSELLSQEQSIVRVTNNSMDSSQTALSIRGFGDNAAANSLILVDGFPLTNVSLLTPNFNSIALADIERIDIVQGSQGSLWGDQAVGGVVNIITRHPEKFVADAQLGLGSFQQNYFNALLGSKFSSGFFFKAFGFTNNTDNYRKHNHQRNESIYGQSGIDYARGTLSIGFQSSETTVMFPGGLSQQQFDSDASQAVNFKNFSHIKTQILQLLDKHELNPDLILETRISHQQVDGDGVIGSAFNRNEWENSFNPKLTGLIRDKKFTLGYLVQNSQYNFINSSIHERAHAVQNDVYAQTIIPLTNLVDLTLGARLAWQYNTAEEIIGQPVDSMNRVFVTEQGVSYHPSPEWQFFIRRDGNFRFPKANEETWSPPGTAVLQTQTGVSYEAGITRNTDKQKSQLNLYQLELNHEIAFDPTQTPEQPFGQYRNFETTRRRGITLTEYYRLTPEFALDAQINYVDPRFASGPFSGKRIPAVPSYTANAGVNYDFIENWRVKYSALYTGARFASLDDANIGKRLGGYWISTIALQYIRKSFDVSFEIDNMFNQKYSTYTLFTAPSNSYLYYPGAGRSYLLTIKTSID
jgi:iron complex outermembrane receptor protein